MDETTGETNLQVFVRTLYEAYFASKAVDYFDLRSDDPVSRVRWGELLAAQRAAFRELHEVCCRTPMEDLATD